MARDLRKSKKPSVNWKESMLRRGHAPLPRYGAYHVMLIQNLPTDEYNDPADRAFHSVFTALDEYIHECGGPRKYAEKCDKMQAEKDSLNVGDPFPVGKLDHAKKTLALYRAYKKTDWSREDPIKHGWMLREAAELYSGWWT